MKASRCTVALVGIAAAMLLLSSQDVQAQALVTGCLDPADIPADLSSDWFSQISDDGDSKVCKKIAGDFEKACILAISGSQSCNEQAAKSIATSDLALCSPSDKECKKSVQEQKKTNQRAVKVAANQARKDCKSIKQTRITDVCNAEVSPTLR